MVRRKRCWKTLRGMGGEAFERALEYAPGLCSIPQGTSRWTSLGDRHEGAYAVRITLIGGGYVGLVSGACFAEFGTDVTVMETDEGKLAALRAGKMPIYEPGLESRSCS